MLTGELAQCVLGSGVSGHIGEDDSEHLVRGERIVNGLAVCIPHLHAVVVHDRCAVVLVAYTGGQRVIYIGNVRSVERGLRHGNLLVVSKPEGFLYVLLVNQVNHNLYHYVLLLRLALGNHQSKGYKGVVS